MGVAVYGASSQIPPFHISVAGLKRLTQHGRRLENLSTLIELGGPDELCRLVLSDPVAGLARSEEGDAERRRAFGANRYPEPPFTGWWALFFESFQEMIIIILCAAAITSFVIGMIEDPASGWTDGVAIFLAVLIVAVVTASNNYSKEKQFRALNAEKNRIDVKVWRAGHRINVPVEDILVGEIVELETGDKIPADGVYLSGHNLEANESSLTGEPDDLKKNRTDDPFMLGGCQITAGTCRMLVIAVGVHSIWGEIKSRLATEEDDTPLQVCCARACVRVYVCARERGKVCACVRDDAWAQEKLDDMAKKIGYVGMFAAAGTFVALVIMFFVTTRVETLVAWLIKSFIYGVTIIVVAIPEGLPLAVTISLAYSTKKMLADKNLIRVLAACETMGNATTICSDKTGTLTQNRMTVVEAWMGGTHFEFHDVSRRPAIDDMPAACAANLCVNACVNSTATLDLDPSTGWVVTGSKTEGALLMLAQDWKSAPLQVRAAANIVHLYSFSSARKSMSVLVALPNGSHRLYVKGAAEVVLSRCAAFTRRDGSEVALDARMREEIGSTISGMARGALRTLALAHRDFPGALPDDIEHAAPEVRACAWPLEHVLIVLDGPLGGGGGGIRAVI